MNGDDQKDQAQQADRHHYEQGLPDYHDPLAGIGGAPAALSALTLRLVLATFGLLVCAAGAVISVVAGAPLWFTIVLVALAITAVVDLAVIIGRKRRGEPG
jgi:hypothetical protein